MLESYFFFILSFDQSVIIFAFIILYLFKDCSFYIYLKTVHLHVYLKTVHLHIYLKTVQITDNKN